MEYIDRDDFITKASLFIKKINKPAIVLIAANSGIGKHSAVLKLLNYELANNYTAVSMLSYSANEGTSILKNKYFFKIIELIQNNYRHFNDSKSKLSFEKFVKRNKKIQRQISTAIARATIEDASTSQMTKSGALQLVLKYIHNRLQISNIENSKKVLSEDTVYSANIGREYLKYILCNDDIILDLRSAQYMDQETITNICGALTNTDKTSKSVIIMEYDTDGDNAQAEFIHFRTLLQNTIGIQNVFSYDLQPLNLNDFINAVSRQLNQDIEIYKSWIQKEYLELGVKSISVAVNEFYRAEKQGKLMLGMIPIVEYGDYFNEIGPACLCILSILDIHGGRINKSLLKKLYIRMGTALNDEYLQERIKLMISQHFILEDDEDIFFFNRSVKDVWIKYLSNTSDKSPGILVAATKCYDYYENMVKTKKNEKISAHIKEPILILLRIIEFYIPNRIINLTTYIQMIAQNFTSPEEAWKPISLLLNELSQYGKDYLETYYNIIDLCCDLELYKEALQIWYDIKDIAFNPNEFECSRANFLFCKVHYLADKHIEVINFTQNMLQKNLNPTSKLYYSIYLIITYRACNQYDKITPVVEYIYKNKKQFCRLPQYGLFLRISETYKPRVEAIPDVEESVTFFRNFDLNVQAAKSQVSLSFLYTITGDLAKGLSALNEAKCVLKDSYQYIICNNEAAIRLFYSKFDTDTENLLKQAVMCSNGIFSNLVIYNNLMILYYETNDNTNLMLRIDAVKSMISDLIDKHLIAIISYNLSLFLERINREESQKYLEMAYANSEHDTALKARLFSLAPQNACEKFVLQKPWHVTMLTFWETDFMID